MTEPLIRDCAGCAQRDDAPRHEIIDFAGEDAHGGPMHFDCCVEQRDCDLCRLQLERAHAWTGDAPNTLKDDALRAALVELAPMQVEHADTPTSPFDLSFREVMG